MIVYSGRGIGDFYYKLFNDITNEGKELTIRGKRVKELPEPVTLEYTDPSACWMLIPGRRMNPFFCLAEVMWMWSGRGDVEWISQYNSNMRSFQDGDNPNFHGAYGLRVRKWKPYWGFEEGTGFFDKDTKGVDQLQEAINKIVADPCTRQAVISLWDPISDNIVKSKDYPCNNLVYFSLRDCKLNMTVVIRSNDLIWGTPHNSIQFGHLLAIATGMLNDAVAIFPGDKGNVQMGTLTYVVQNIHYYLDLYPETLDVIKKAVEREYLHERGYPGALKHDFFSIPSTEDFKEACKICFEDIGTGDFNNTYWTETIPRMLFIYDMIKERKSKSIQTSVLREQKVGDLFTLMIKDFYSNKPDVMEILNGQNQGD